LEFTKYALVFTIWLIVAIMIAYPLVKFVLPSMLWVLGVLTLYITKEIRNRTWYTSNQTIRTEYITDGVKCFIRQFKVVKCRFHTSRFFHSINSKSNNGGNKDSFNNTPKMLDDFIDDKIHNGDIINGLPTKSKQNLER